MCCELGTKSSTLIILSLYRAPIGDFNQFIKNLDVVKHLYKPKTKFLICGDIHTNYLIAINRKKQLASLITTYNLLHTVNFATRIQYNSCTAMDNIFVDNSRINLSYISPTINCPSDHDAQILTITNIYIYIYIYIYISFKGENQINRQYNNHAFSDSTKKRKLGICLYRYKSYPHFCVLS